MARRNTIDTGVWGKHGCIWWLLIGWWWRPILYILWTIISDLTHCNIRIRKRK